MKKLKSIFALMLIVLFSCNFLVACGDDDSSKTEVEVAQELLDEAYASFLVAGKYVQEISYEERKNGIYLENEDGENVVKIVTNNSENTLKRHYTSADKSKDDIDVIISNKSTIESYQYNLKTKTYIHASVDIDEVILIGGKDAVEIANLQIAANSGALDLDYSKYFSLFYEQYREDYADTTIKYSSFEDSGFTFVSCVITSDDTQLTHMVAINSDGYVSSIKVKEEDISTGDYTQKIHKFRYTGDDLTISINADEFTEVEED